jgi:hypothetical protein
MDAVQMERLAYNIREAVAANNNAAGACPAARARLQGAIDAWVNRERR